MGRLFSVLVIMVLSLLGPPLLVMGAITTGSAGSSGGGASSVLVDELRSLGYQNGRLPDEALVTVSTHGSYACRVAAVGGAADAWMLLVEVAAVDGVDIEGGWCYRTYEEQLAVWTSRRCYVPGNCDGDPYPPTAEPGTSVHGWGLAIDIWGAADLTLSCNSPEFGWMQVNGPRFGWVHPAWAHCGQPAAEPWHWEFAGTPATEEPEAASAVTRGGL